MWRCSHADLRTPTHRRGAEATHPDPDDTLKDSHLVPAKRLIAHAKHVKAGGHMDYDQERSLRQAAKANRKRLEVAHREVVMQEVAKKAVDIRQNMARLKELRLVKEAQEARIEISKANHPPAPKPRQFI
jgi:hypothetical protein